MNIIYRCEYCNEEYEKESDCQECEKSCKEAARKVKKKGEELVKCLKEIKKAGYGVMIFGEDLNLQSIPFSAEIIVSKVENVAEDKYITISFVRM